MSLATNNSPVVSSTERPVGQFNCVLGPDKSRSGGVFPCASMACTVIDDGYVFPVPGILRSAGFAEIDAVDLTAEYLATQRRWLAATLRHEDGLCGVLGDDAVRERSLSNPLIRRLKRWTLAEWPDHWPERKVFSLEPQAD